MKSSGSWHVFGAMYAIITIVLFCKGEDAVWCATMALICSGVANILNKLEGK